MNRRDFLLWHKMRANGLDPNLRNRIVFNYKETLMHFITKCLVSRITYHNGYVFMTEAPVVIGEGVHYIDVLDCSNGIAYEVQNAIDRNVRTNKSMLYSADIVRDVIIIDLKKISSDVYVAKRQLEKIVV